MDEMAEVTDVHTRLLKFGFGLDESRAYWLAMEADLPATDQPTTKTAFENHWFGVVSEARVTTILRNMRVRYDNFPAALEVLCRWKEMSPATRRLVVHWHLQLADPLYRAFTGSFLVDRRQAFDSDMYRDVAIRWVEEQQPGRWAASSKREFGTRLLGAARQAGLVEGKSDPRPLRFPRVPDEALSYALRLFRAVEIEGTFLDNPYLRSVGLWDDFLFDRIKRLDDVHVSRQGDLVEFDSPTPDLHSWWEGQAA